MTPAPYYFPLGAQGSGNSWTGVGVGRAGTCNIVDSLSLGSLFTWPQPDWLKFFALSTKSGHKHCTHGPAYPPSLIYFLSDSVMHDFFFENEGDIWDMGVKDFDDWSGDTNSWFYWSVGGKFRWFLNEKACDMDVTVGWDWRIHRLWRNWYSFTGLVLRSVAICTLLAVQY